MKTKLLLAATAVILGLLAVVTILRPTAQTANNVALMEATYPVYETMTQLVADSPLIVRGKVARVLPAQRVVPEGVDMSQLPEHKAQNFGYAITDVEVQVQGVIAGPADLVNATIVVQQLGGDLDGQLFTMKDEPLSEAEHAYLFFLQPAGEGRYVIVGGSQGRYEIRGGRLVSLSDEPEALPVTSYLNRKAYRQLESNFQQVVSAHAPATQAAPASDEPLNSDDVLIDPQQKPDAPPAP